MKKEKYTKVILIFAILFYTVILVCTSWISDDAYITFRTVDNFLNGYGLRWNVAERVQSYTHPLWMFFIAGTSLIIKNIYLATTVLSFVFVGLTIYLIVKKVSHNNEIAALGVLALAFSKAFIDYSTSGLENPLSYFLLTIFFIIGVNTKPLTKSKLIKLSFVASLIMLNRLDLSLILFPYFLYLLVVLYKEKRLLNGMGYIFTGFLPLVVFEVFSVIYYGFPFPNTAYAKLGVSIPFKDLLLQGVYYFQNSIIFDPLTLFVIFVSVVFAFFKKQIEKKLLALGVLLYLFYIIKIGGDFMSGRFFAVLFLMAILLLTNENHTKNKLVVFSFFVFALGSFQLFHTFLINTKHAKEFTHGIADERLYYYENSGLIPCLKRGFKPNHKRVTAAVQVKKYGLKVAGKGAVGMFGYYCSKDIFVVDKYGLCDPLLARIPKMEYHWRIGHFIHLAPAGYKESLEKDKNLIFDKNLKLFYDKLTEIVRKPLFSKGRLKTILNFNLGKYNYLVDKYKNSKVVLPFGYVSKIAFNYNKWDDLNCIHFTSKGIKISLPAVCYAKYIELAVDSFNLYTVKFIKNQKEISSFTLSRGGVVTGDILHLSFTLKDSIQQEGFDSIEIIPNTKNGANTLGYFVLLDKDKQSIGKNLLSKPEISSVMKTQILKKTGEKDFIFVDFFGVLNVTKDSDKNIVNNLVNSLENANFIAVKNERINYSVYKHILKMYLTGKCKLIENNVGYSLFKINKNTDKKAVQSATNKLIYKWSVFGEGKVKTYKNKKTMKGKGVLFFTNNGMVTGVAKENSSFITFFGNDKVWKKNAGYIQVESGVIEISITAESLYKPFNIHPFVAFYNDKGNRIKTISCVKLKVGEKGEYKLYFKQGKNSLQIPFTLVPSNAKTMGIGFNFYKDKGFLNVEKFEVFKY